MNKLAGNFVKAALCAAIVVGAGTARAAPQQPRIFTPSCAAPPRCADHICLRMGRCSLGSHAQPMGCLIYSCKHGAH
jgi:hypothetical protein